MDFAIAAPQKADASVCPLNPGNSGVPERVAMQLSGHKTRAIFERYNITSPQDLRDAAARLDRYERARP